MKHCSKCGELKPLDAFARQAAHSTGRRARCKACSRLDQSRSRRSGDPCAAAYARGFEAKGRRSVPQLDADTLKAAAALTHPDRHPSREAEATRVTAALNAARCLLVHELDA